MPRRIKLDRSTGVVFDLFDWGRTSPQGRFVTWLEARVEVCEKPSPNLLTPPG